tara:strand:+ start:1004 stop:1150 length:147 start_codon:yes stop_codon:yes gene_type:complete
MRSFLLFFKKNSSEQNESFTNASGRWIVVIARLFRQQGTFDHDLPVLD